MILLPIGSDLHVSFRETRVKLRELFLFRLRLSLSTETQPGDPVSLTFRSESAKKRSLKIPLKQRKRLETGRVAEEVDGSTRHDVASENTSIFFFSPSHTAADPSCQEVTA